MEVSPPTAGTADMVARAQAAGVPVILTWQYRQLFPDLPDGGGAGFAAP